MITNFIPNVYLTSFATDESQFNRKTTSFGERYLPSAAYQTEIDELTSKFEQDGSIVSTNFYAEGRWHDFPLEEAIQKLVILSHGNRQGPIKEFTNEGSVSYEPNEFLETINQVGVVDNLINSELANRSLVVELRSCHVGQPSEIFDRKSFAEMLHKILTNTLMDKLQAQNASGGAFTITTLAPQGVYNMTRKGDAVVIVPMDFEYLTTEDDNEKFLKFMRAYNLESSKSKYATHEKIVATQAVANLLDKVEENHSVKFELDGFQRVQTTLARNASEEWRAI